MQLTNRAEGPVIAGPVPLQEPAARPSRWPGRQLLVALAGAALTLLWPGAAFATSDLEVLTGPDGELGQWLLLGPMRLPGSARGISRLARAPLGLEVTPGRLVPGRPVLRQGARPGSRRSARKSRWRLLTGHEPVMDMRRLLHLGWRRRYVAAFLGVILQARRATTVYLALGHDDGLAVWLNGRRVVGSFAPQTFVGEQRLVPLRLAQGRNRLVLQLAHGRGRWRVAVRLTGSDHRPLGAHGSASRVRLFLPTPSSAAAGSRRLARLAARGLVMRLRRRFSPRGLLFRLAAAAPAGLILPPGGHLAYSHGLAERRGRRRGDLRATLVDLRRVARGGWSLPLAEGSLTLGIRRARWLVLFAPGGKGRWARLWRGERICGRLAMAEQHLAKARRRVPGLPAASLASVAYHLQDLRRLLVAGERSSAYLRRRLGTVARWAASLAKGRDPFGRLRGRIVKAYRSHLDGSYQPYSIYVPAGYSRRRSWPLYVMLHGMGGGHRQALSQMLGTWMTEKQARRLSWRRFLRSPPPAKLHPRALVLAPEAFGDAFYHQEGEVAVFRAMAEVMRHYRVDPRRVILVGHSMGGTGVLELGLTRPHLFAGMVSLAGYPSRWIHSDVRRGPLLPWERLLAERYSPQRWARNGRHLPLIAVHGTKDGPYRSRGMVRALARLGFGATLKLFECGHAVWRQYLDRGQVYSQTAHWRTPTRPRRVTFATTRLRWGRAYWVRLGERLRSGAWASVDARFRRGSLRVRTQNLRQISLLLDRAPTRNRSRVVLRIDGTALTVPGRGVVTLRRRGGLWHPGRARKVRTAGPGLWPPRKVPGLEGPMDDIHYGPVLVVYGTRLPAQRAALERVARRLARHGSSEIRYPVKADTQVTAADRANHNLLLVGGPLANRETARHRGKLPIQVTSREVRVGRCRFVGPDVGVKLIYPSPDTPNRYILIVAGTTARGVLRQHLLPRYLPDFVVYDSTVELPGSRRIVGAGRRYLAAGTFDARWRLPTVTCPKPGKTGGVGNRRTTP